MEQLFISRQSRHSASEAVIYSSTFSFLYLDLACEQLCFPLAKGINKRNENTRDT